MSCSVAIKQTASADEVGQVEGPDPSAAFFLADGALNFPASSSMPSMTGMLRTRCSIGVQLPGLDSQSEQVRRSCLEQELAKVAEALSSEPHPQPERWFESQSLTNKEGLDQELKTSTHVAFCL